MVNGGGGCQASFENYSFAIISRANAPVLHPRTKQGARVHYLGLHQKTSKFRRT